MTTMGTFEKLRIALRYSLQGAGFHDALRAMEFAEGHHTGMRKDKVTPEVQHQFEIVLYTKTLGMSLIDAEKTYIVEFLHDTTEDKGVAPSVIGQLWGHQVEQAVWLMDRNGKNVSDYYPAIAEDSIASVAKLADRINNMGSMSGVFTVEKQIRYCDETRNEYFPLIKTARRKFPQQEAVYENMKFVLATQVDLISRILDARIKVGEPV